MEPFQSSFYRESLPPSAQTSIGEAALPAPKSHADGPTTRARGRWPRRLPGTFTPEGGCGIGHGRRSTRECRLRVGPTFLGAPHDNLPTAQGLDADGEGTN